MIYKELESKRKSFEIQLVFFRDPTVTSKQLYFSGFDRVSFLLELEFRLRVDNGFTGLDEPVSLCSIPAMTLRSLFN